MPEPVLVYLGLGSNLGEREAHLRFALDELANLLTELRTSSVYESAAIGPGVQPPYLNMAVCGYTGLSPRELLTAILAIETRRGRVREERWGPRCLDIDLLFYGELVQKDEDPILPHPRIMEREFVLRPLRDLGWRA